MEDNMIQELYSNENCKVFEENFSFLAALYSQKGILHIETFMELSKEEFVNIFLEGGFL